MAPIGLSPNQVLLTATTVDRWNFGMKNGLRLHGLSAALRTIKPAPGAEWTIGCGLSGPSQHRGGNSGDSHQAGVSSAHSGQRSGEPPAVPQGSSAPTQRQPTTSGTSGGGEETGGKASTSKDAAPSAPQRADNKQHIHLLAIEFRALYMAETETVTLWFDRLRRLAAKLIEGGQPITEQDGVELAILGARHARFQALQQTVMAANGSMSYASVLQMYESAERLNLRLQPTSPFFPTYVKYRPLTLSSPPPVVPGYVADANAGGRGAGRHNPGRGRGGGQGRGRVGALLCTHCKSTTHLVDTCWTKYPHLRPSRSPPANSGRGGGVGRGAPAGGGAPVSRVEFDALVSQLAGYSLMTLWQIPVSPLGVYQFDAVVGEIPSLLCVDLDVSIPPMAPIELWHKRFCHPGFPVMSQLIQGTLVTGMPIISNQQLRKFKESPCDACARGKAKRVPYHEPRRKTHSSLEIVHVDLMGPFSQGLKGEYYLLVMVDEYSNWQAVVAMVTKGDSAFWIVNTLKVWMALLVGVVLGCLRSDQAKEFCTAEVEDFLKSVKARHELSSVYCPQQNGNAERMNGVVAATARTMLLDNSHRIIESRDVDWYEGAGPAPVPGQDPFNGDFSLDSPDTAVNVLGPEVVTSPTPSDSPVGTAAGSDSGFRNSDSESGPGFHMQLRSRNQAPAVFPTIVQSRWHPEPTADPHDVPPYMTTPRAHDSRASEQGGVAEDTAAATEILSPTSTVAPGWGGVTGVGVCVTPLGTGQLGGLGPIVPDSPVWNRVALAAPIKPVSSLQRFFDPPVPVIVSGVTRSRRQAGQAPEMTGLVTPPRSRRSNVPDLPVLPVSPVGELVRYPPSPVPAVLSSSPPSDLVDNPLFLDATSASGSVSGGDTPEPVSEAPGLTLPAYISTSSDISYTQAMDQSNPHRDVWLLAMRDEMESLHAHGTWQLVKLPLGVVPIKNRWCFSFKHGDNGVVVRQKARVVAKGFLQRAGLDYDLTFAPVTSKSTLRTLLAGMVHNKMFARQLDIKTAFMNGVLEEELYMEQPQGYVVPGGWVCKLIKSLYGLKQSPRKWCEEVRRVLRIAGFTPAQADPVLFICLEPDGTVSWVLTYVDDFWLALHCLILYAKIVAIMRKAKWTVTEMGVPKVFLSIDCDLTLDSAGRCVSIVISQHNQIFGMLERYPIALGDETKQSPHVPMISGAVTKHAAGSPALPNNLMYASLIGSLIYLSTCTRPDIAYSVSALSRFTSKPTQAHWRAAQRVLVHLRKYPNLGIRYSHSSDFAVHAYSDASFGDDPEGRRSQTGMAILASGGVVHSASTRQITPAVSTGEAEYQALAATARDVQWFKHLRVDLGLPCSLVTIQCDSTVANSWCAEVALVPRAKHIDIMHHYVRDLGMSGRIGIAKVDTTLQLADAFTKALEAEQFWFLNGLLGMVDCKHGAIPPTYKRPPR
eukprot:gene909-biopygen3461